MKTFNRAVIAIIMSLIIPAISLAWQGKVVNVSDGDTVTVLHDGKQEKVRLYGIDCPEKGQAFGQVAKDFTSSMVAGKVVEVTDKDKDGYGRTVGVVTVEGVNVNISAVESGCAWVYTQYCKEQFCKDWKKAEEAARISGDRMWGDPNIIPPWDWRHGGKQVAAVISVDDNDTRSINRQDAVAGEFHGNVNSRKFHGPWCRHYNCKNCTATFASRNEAVASGYSPCGVCRP